MVPPQRPSVACLHRRLLALALVLVPGIPLGLALRRCGGRGARMRRGRGLGQAARAGAGRHGWPPRHGCSTQASKSRSKPAAVAAHTLGSKIPGRDVVLSPTVPCGAGGIRPQPASAALPGRINTHTHTAATSRPHPLTCLNRPYSASLSSLEMLSGSALASSAAERGVGVPRCVCGGGAGAASRARMPYPSTHWQAAQSARGTSNGRATGAHLRPCRNPPEAGAGAGGRAGQGWRRASWRAVSQQQRRGGACGKLVPAH